MAEDWYAETLRLSLLGVTDWTQRQIFADVAGVQPALINAQPPLQLQQETGEISGSQLAVNQQSDRVDVVLSDLPTRNTIDPSAPDYKPLFSIGPLEESLKTFDEISTKVISMISGATRIAYAITAVHQSDSMRDVGAFLRRYLPTVDFNPENDLDLLFQVNRPTRDKDGRFINRLARWETLQLTTMRFTVGSAVSVSPLPVRPPIYAARVSIDVSTDVNNAVPFEKLNLPGIVHALRSYAVIIAEHGDSK